MRRTERAQALVWLVMLVPLFVSFAGLAVDGAILLSARRELQSVADGAARAGATRVDLARLRASNGTDVELDSASAHAAAQAYFDTELVKALPWDTAPQVEVEIAQRRVHVVVQGALQTAFMRVVNINTVPIEAAADADVQFGIRAGNGT